MPALLLSIEQSCDRLDEYLQFANDGIISQHLFEVPGLVSFLSLCHLLLGSFSLVSFLNFRMSRIKVSYTVINNSVRA